MDDAPHAATDDNWREVDRWFAPTTPARESRRSWRTVIDALGGLGRDTQALRRDAAELGVDPALNARVDALADAIDGVAQCLSVAIGDTPVAELSDHALDVLSLDGRAREALESLDEVAARVESLRTQVIHSEQTLAQISGAPERVADAEATIKGTADDVVALAARAAIEIERVEMTLRTLQAGEEYVHKAVAELESTTAARAQADAILADLQSMTEAARAEREMVRQALQDVERLRGELRSRINRPSEPVAADPRVDPESQIRQVIHELRPMIERAVRKPATPEQIDRLRTVMLEIADADLPSRIEQLRIEAYGLLRDVGVSDDTAVIPPVA